MDSNSVKKEFIMNLNIDDTEESLENVFRENKSLMSLAYKAENIHEWVYTENAIWVKRTSPIINGEVKDITTIYYKFYYKLTDDNNKNTVYEEITEEVFNQIRNSNKDGVHLVNTCDTIHYDLNGLQFSTQLVFSNGWVDYYARVYSDDHGYEEDIKKVTELLAQDGISVDDVFTVTHEEN